VGGGGGGGGSGGGGGGDGSGGGGGGGGGGTDIFIISIRCATIFTNPNLIINISINQYIYLY
jgi:hypothetical protein